MPLTMKDHMLHKRDPLLTQEVGLVDAVKLYGGLERVLALAPLSYALLSPTSSKTSTLSAPHLEQMTIVAHCEETRRTSVSLTSTRGVAMGSFVEQFRWLAEGESRIIHVVQIHDIHLGFSDRDLEISFTVLAESAGVQVTFPLRPAHPINLQNSTRTIQVDTLTGLITLYQTPSPDHYVNTSAPIGSLEENLEQFQRGLLLNFLKTIKVGIEGDLFASWMQYDGKELYRRLPPLSDLARDLLRSAIEGRLAEGDGRHGVQERHFEEGRRTDTGEARRIPPKQLARESAPAAVAVDAFCIVCRKQKGAQKCGACGWEYYCGSEHQKLAWPGHRSWCKKDRK